MQPEASVVRIFAIDGAVVGTGFFVGEGTLLTCAHVVADALGIDENTTTIPTTPVCLDFPLVDSRYRLTAQVTFWQPVQTNGGGDIAVLHLDSIPPNGVKAARLMFTEDLWDHSFRAFGFPEKHDQGVWASGKLRAREATGWVQIEDVKDPGKRVQPGFSGGAVWDEQLDGVAGMIVAADEDTSKVAYIIPTNALTKAWPALGQHVILPCPYRGLFAFREQDAAFFFGRERFTNQLMEAVRKKPLVAVIGPSGSGKSSIVFAGLLPRIRQQGNWLIASFRPGNRPFRSLAVTLLPLLEPQMAATDRLIETNKLTQQFQQGKLALSDVIELILQKDIVDRFLLIVDQFEELYTLCQDLEERQRFLDTLLALVQAASVQRTLAFNLIFTIRADFVGSVLSHRPLTDALQQSDIKLGPMTTQELQDVINKPAEKLHVRIENGLTERILSEVSQEVGNLPLLQFALTLLWSKQKDGKLSHTSYDEIGSVEKALADYAEEIYTGLNEEGQQLAQQIFVQLVRPGNATEDTRRLATRAELGERKWELVARLADARLVTSGRDQGNGEETVEVIHEALIRGWQRLREWIDNDRDFLVWQERLRGALHQWEDSGKDDGALLRGILLAEAVRWVTQRAETLNQAELEFIQASRNHQAREAQRWEKLYKEAEQQRLEAERQKQLAQQREQEAEQRRQEAEKQRLEAERQKQLAEYNRQEAERQRQIARARQLATQAELLRDQNPHLIERSVLLAIEAEQIFSCLETKQALRDGAALLRQRVAYISHKRMLKAMALSPDGKCLATASGENILLWEIPSGRQLSILTYKENTTALTFSPDGKYLAACGATATLWEVPSGHQFLRLNLAHYINNMSVIAFSPDGKYLAAACGAAAALWEVPSGHQLADLSLTTTPMSNDSVTSLAFSPDGKFLAVANKAFLHRGSAALWEVTSGHKFTTFSHTSDVKAAVFSPDSKYLVTASANGIAALWDISTAGLYISLPHKGSVMAATFNSDGKYLATASSDGTAILWEVPEGRQLATFLHKKSVMSVAFSPDGRRLATASSDGTATLWDVMSSQQYALLPHKGSVLTVTFSSDGKYLATASDDNSAVLWNTFSNSRSSTLLYEGGVTAMAFSSNGKYTATAIRDSSRTSTVILSDFSNGRQLAAIPHRGRVSAVTFSPDGKYLATASGNFSRSGAVILAEVPGGLQLRHFPHKRYVTAVAFSPDGKYLATASEAAIVLLWDTSNNQQLKALRHKASVTAVAFSPSGHLLASASSDGFAILWDALSGRRLLTLSHHAPVMDVAFSPSGHLLASASSDGSATLWDTSSGSQLAILPHEANLTAVIFNSDERFLATASGDYTSTIWEVNSRRQLMRVTHEKNIEAVTFSADGLFLVTGSEDQSVRFWLWQSESLIAEAQSCLTRNLTQEEWRQYMNDEPYRKTCPNLS